MDHLFHLPPTAIWWIFCVLSKLDHLACRLPLINFQNYSSRYLTSTIIVQGLSEPPSRDLRLQRVRISNLRWPPNRTYLAILGHLKQIIHFKIVRANLILLLILAVKLTRIAWFSAISSNFTKAIFYSNPNNPENFVNLYSVFQKLDHLTCNELKLRRSLFNPIKPILEFYYMANGLTFEILNIILRNVYPC